MADQRPGFRFRLPWLPAGQPARPSFPPRPPTQPTATPTPTPTPRTPQTAAPQNPPIQPTRTTTTTSTTPQRIETQVPPAQPTTNTTSTPTVQTAETEALPQSTIATTTTPTTIPQPAETQNPTQPATSTTTPIPTTERPPFRPPELAPPQAPSPQSQISRTQPQPSSPSRSTIQPQIPSQPVSPARAATQSRAPSQPSTPPRATPQARAAQVQTTTEAVNQLTSPLKGEQSLTKESSQPSASSTEVISSTSDIPEPKSVISESPSPDLQLKAETISGGVYDSHDRAPLETGSQLDEMKKQPPKESWTGAAKTSTPAEGPETPALTQISNNSTINPEPESFPEVLKPDETKEVKEVMQGAKDKTQDEAKYKDANIQGAPSNTLHNKGTSNAFQSEQTQKTVSRKDITATSASNGRQTKTTTAQPRNKNMVLDNHQKLPISNREQIPLHKEIREDISKLVHKMAAGQSKHSIDGPVSVVTLTGENRGATMHLGSDSSRKEGAVRIHRGYMNKPNDDDDAKTDGEECFKAKSNNPKTKEDQAPEDHINSNVQGINNSFLFNSSITERNPGVHVIRSNIPTESKKPSRKPLPLETRKAEFNMTPSQKLTHEPIVRRRCLRGLFLESSDSDLDGTKSQHHGCRVGCNEKRKENNVL